MEHTDCLICGYPNIEFFNSSENYRINCGRCGDYFVTDTLYRTFADVDIKEELVKKGYITSAVIRELNETKQEIPRLNTKNYRTLWEHYLVPDLENVETKVKKLLQRIKERSAYYGSHVSILHDKDYPLGYAQNPQEFSAQVKLLEDSNLLKIRACDTAKFIVELSARGWGLAKDSSTKNSNQVFVAVWFDPSTEGTINTICTSIKECGYEAMCIKNEHFSEKIMDKAIGEIKQSKFMIADLTGNRTSVFFEIGLAYGLGIEIIYLFKKDEVKEKTPLDFYVKHYQCYSYKNATDIPEILKNAINARIK